jgi:hypothetical protein
VDKPLNLISIKNRIPFFLKAKKSVYDEAFKSCPKITKNIMEGGKLTK